MKDILKIIKFDFLTGGSAAFTGLLFGIAVIFLLSLFLAPMINGYISLIAMLPVIPLQSTAEKNGFNKLYGILPVSRKNITRGRFIYISCVFLCSEILGIILALISKALKLYRFLPNQGSENLKVIENSFSDNELTFSLITGMAVFFIVVFTYMEMMGQIFGRENEIKIIVLTLGILSALLIAFFVLSDKGIIPTFKLPSMPSSFTGRLILYVFLNIAAFALSVIFGEITASRIAKREL